MNYQDLEERIEELEARSENLEEEVKQKIGILQLSAFIVTIFVFYFIGSFIIKLFTSFF